MEEDINQYYEHAQFSLNEEDRAAIENIIERNETLDKDNNDLRRLYRRTAAKLKENGKDELAYYFLAQIDETPTFTVEDDIDYYKEYHNLLKRNKELEEEIKTLKGNKIYTVEEMDRIEKEDMGYDR